MDTIKEYPIHAVKKHAYYNVAASFLIWGLALAGLSMMMPVMYNNIAEDMGWTLGQTTMFMVIKSGVSGIVGLFAGTMFVRYGIKRIYVLAVAACGLSVALLYFTDTLWFYYAIAVISGVASIVCGIAFQIIMAKWFSASLGKFFGIAMLGSAFAGSAVPLATTYLVILYGWKITAAISGMIVFIPLSLVAIFFVKESPEQYGYSADELDPGKNPMQKNTPFAGFPFKETYKSRPFMLVLFTIFLSGAFSNGINEHTPLFLSKQANFGPYMAALGFTAIMIISGVGKLLFGWLYDKYSMKGVAICWILCSFAIASAFPVALSLPISGFITFALFVTARGLAQGGILVQIPIIARHMFGQIPIIQVIAFLNAAFYLGAAFGIGAIGWGYDLTGDYTVPFLCIILISFMAGITAFYFKPLYWSGYKEECKPIED